MKYQELDQLTTFIIENLEAYCDYPLLWNNSYRNSIDDYTLDILIENQWNYTYNLAISDHYITIKEQERLNEIQTLAQFLKNPLFRDMLKFKLDASYRNKVEHPEVKSENNQYDSIYSLPKCTPDTYYYKKRDDDND
jgi:hypothetical protein